MNAPCFSASWRTPVLAALFLLGLVGSEAEAASPGYSVEIDLQEQQAYLLRDGRKILESPISSGRANHRTPTGSFQVIEKDLDHHSTLYGKIVDRQGNTIVSNADADMAVPRGAKFVNAPMHYFMRFNGSVGMHAGYLPGYPASHGCVRMPRQFAIAFYNAVEVGTPVTVFGTTGRPRLSRSDQDSSRAIR